jgi:hypothetical protein
MAAQPAASSGRTRPKGRSTSYPALNLESAIARAKQLHDKERTYATPVETVAGYFGYGSLSGAATAAIAALKKYGLLEDEGSGNQRKAKLSQLAEVILQHPDEAARRAAIREAALRPPIHRELWDKYRDQLPSDSNLRWELTHERGFTERGAAEFIPVYRATIAFARLASDEPEPSLDGLGHDDEDLEVSEHVDDPPVSDAHRFGTGSRQGRSSLTRSYSIPLIGGSVIEVAGAFPVTESDWEQFMAVLVAMKPGLVRVETVSASDE